MAALVVPIGLMLPTIALANACPAGYDLVANEDLPVVVQPPSGADENHNGYQCFTTQGQGHVLYTTDDVPEDVDLTQCGTQFSPIPFDRLGDPAKAVIDRNEDGIVCIRVTDLPNVEIYRLRDN